MTDTLSPPESAAPEAPRRRGGHPARAAFRAELRRGIAPWTAPAVALTIAVTMLGKSGQWQGGWADTQELLHASATLLGGPLVAAAGCWQGGRDHRRRTAGLWLSVPRGRPARLVMAAAPVAVWAVVGHLLAAAGVLAATWPYAGAGGPSAELIAVDAWFLVCAAFTGFVVGRVWRWRLAAPVLAAAGYLFLGVPTYFASDLRLLNPAEQYYLGDQVPVGWFAPVMVLWVGAPVLALVIGYAARRRLFAVVPLAVAAALAPLIVSSGEDLFRDDPVAWQLICTDEAPQVCVGGREGPLLPQVSDALAGLRSRLDGVPGAPLRYVSVPVSGGGRTPAGASRLPGPTLGWTVVRGRLVDPVAYASETARQLSERDCPDSASAEDESVAEGDASAAAEAEEDAHIRVMQIDDAVVHWLAPSNATAPARDWSGPYLDRLTAMDDAERRAWLGRYLATRDSCDPKEVPAL
ncbi:hypothetical protein [Streptomyces sp. cmx-18-6]|uniref:hypothetical protein n=1 Tax=Streptomyces sp. cmx-18-6 TaxID=2790930 RepID=UPI00397F0180